MIKLFFQNPTALLSNIIHFIKRYRSKGLFLEEFSTETSKEMDRAMDVSISLYQNKWKQMSFPELIQLLPNDCYTINKHLSFTIYSEESISKIVLVDSLFNEKFVIQYSKEFDNSFKCINTLNNQSINLYSEIFIEFLVYNIITTRGYMFNVNKKLLEGIIAIKETANAMIKAQEDLINK